MTFRSPVSHAQRTLAFALSLLVVVAPASGREFVLQGREVSVAGLREVLGKARASLAAAPDEDVAVRLPAGDFLLSEAHAQAAIDLSDISRETGRGRLVLSGQGMDKTHLIVDEQLFQIYGRNVRRVTIQDIEFSRPRPTVTQGRVASIDGHSVTLSVDAGLPSPADIRDDTPRGHYLRKCALDGSGYYFPESNNAQVAWEDARQVGAQQWRFDVRQRRGLDQYKVGDLIAVKSKHGGQAYWFSGGGDITFDRLRWLDVSRGVFRGGMSDIAILNSRVERRRDARGQSPCLSTPGGGPQLGQPGDPPTRNVRVQGNRIDGTGDDAIALFNADGIVSDNVVNGSFARGILLVNSPQIELRNNTVNRSPVLRKDR